MVSILLFSMMSQMELKTVSLPFIKAEVVCNNKQNDTDKTFFTASCLKIMANNYKPVKVYYASYDKDGKEIINLVGEASCVYVTKDQIYARLELDKKLPQPIEEFVLNAKTYSSKGDFYISTSCVVEINRAEIKHFVLRPKNKAIIFE
jgi:hypothetical protein